MRARYEFREFGAHALARERTARQGLHKVARFPERTDVGIDKNLGAR